MLMLHLQFLRAFASSALAATNAQPANMSIADKLASIDTKTEARLVSTVDEVLAELERDGKAWRARLNPKHVGVHSKNRSGWGVTPSRVHQLGSEVFEMGWSPGATVHAVCTEDFDGSAATFTKSLFDNSDGMLGNQTGDVRYGSLSCSHTNQWLVAVLSGVKSEYENICMNGCMSYEMVAKQPLLKDALDNGLTWLVISAEAVKMYPKLPELVQAAKNATGAVHQREDAFQLLRQIQSLAASRSTGGQAVDWSAVSSIVARRSQCMYDDISHLLAFAQKWGGGSSSAFMDDLCKFHKAHVKPGRVVPNTTWKALADLKLGVHELCPFFVYAVLKTQVTCADKHCDGKVCKYITVGDINSLSSQRKSEMLAAEKLLAECRALARTHHVSGDKCTRAFGRLDVFVAKVVLKKDVKDTTSMEGIAEQFYREIGITSGAPTSSHHAPDETPNVVQYDEFGAAVGAAGLSLRADGFNVGSTVKTTKDLLAGQYGLFEILNIKDDGTVTIKDLQKLAVSEVSFDDFTTSYKKTNEKYEEFKEWQSHVPAKQDHYIDSIDRAHILLAMSSYSTDTTDLSVVKLPEKAVFAKTAHNVGKLQLVPETTKVQFEEKLGSLKGVIGHRNFFVLPTAVSTDFAAPAWAIRGTSSGANMHVVLKKVSIQVGEETRTVQIPVVTNSAKIKNGDELLIAKVDTNTKGPNKRLLNLQPEAKAKAKK